MTFELTVARCGEDLAWLRRVPKPFRIKVYDKSGGSEAAGAPHRASLVRLPNVGREAHAYLHHIVAHYDTPAAVSVFAQGRPFDHVPDLHRILRGLADGTRKASDFEWLGFVLDWDDPAGARLFQKWSKNPQAHPLALARFHEELFGAPCPERVLFYPSAHFIVTAECIRRRPRSFYERALRLSETFPEAAHCFERCWNRVFLGDGLPAGVTWEQLPVFTKPIRRLLATQKQSGP